MSNGNRLEQQVALLDDGRRRSAATRPHRSRGAAGGIDGAPIGDPAVRVIVAGEFKMGKSALVNALLESPVCPVDEDLATAVPTLVRWADDTRGPDDRSIRRTSAPSRSCRAIAYDDRADYCSEAGNHDNDRGLQLVELGLPAPMLAGGLQLVDTPGVGGLASVHNAATVAALPAADAVLFVSDAAQELSAPELDFLRAACSACPVVIEVVSKIDFQPAWRRIVELDRGHLGRAEPSRRGRCLCRSCCRPSDPDSTRCAPTSTPCERGRRPTRRPRDRRGPDRPAPSRAGRASRA